MTYESKTSQEKVLLIFQLNDNEDTMYQNLWDAAKAVPGGIFIALSCINRTEKRSQINNLSFYLKKQKRKLNASKQKIGNNTYQNKNQ